MGVALHARTCDATRARRPPPARAAPTPTGGAPSTSTSTSPTASRGASRFGARLASLLLRSPSGRGLNAPPSPRGVRGPRGEGTRLLGAISMMAGFSAF